VEHGLVSAVKGEQHSFHCTGSTQDQPQSVTVPIP